MQFEASEHPFILSNFMNIFAWSCPFLAEKVSEMFVHLLKYRRNMADKARKEKYEDVPVENFLLLEQMENKLFELIEVFGNTRKGHEEFVRKNEALSLTEELFEKLKLEDITEKYVEFGPKVILSPLKTIHFEEDDALL